MTGDAGRRGRVLAHPSSAPVSPAPLPTVEEADVPNDLKTDERLVWLKLAPHAIQNGTLVAASEVAFGLLCQNIVRERKYGESLTECGTANHRGLIQRVEAGLDAFGLRPLPGKPLAQPQAEKRVSPLERFLKRG